MSDPSDASPKRPGREGCAEDIRRWIAERQAVVAAMGAAAALDHFIATGQQETAARDVLEPKDFAAWRALPWEMGGGER